MSINLIKNIRLKTNLPFKDIKKAVEIMGDKSEDEIISYLREQGLIKSKSRSDRSANQGSIFTYTHESRIGVMVEIKCETDFVARSEDFQSLGSDITLHIAAYQPRFIDSSQADAQFIENELAIAREQLLNEGKPSDKIDMILQGKKIKLLKEESLLTQKFLKDPKVTVEDYMSSISQKTGEKLEITRFVIYSLT